MKNDEIIDLIESHTHKIIATKDLLNLITIHHTNETFDSMLLILELITESLLEDSEQLFGLTTKNAIQ